MSNEIKIGSIVRCTNVVSLVDSEKRGFHSESYYNRASFRNEVCRVIDRSSGHGLCFQVGRAPDGLTAWFDEDELTLVKDSVENSSLRAAYERGIYDACQRLGGKIPDSTISRGFDFWVELVENKEK